MNRVYSASSGGVVERPKALVLKTRDGKLSVGSNPTLSANLLVMPDIKQILTVDCYFEPS